MKVVYSDIDANLKKNPITNDVVVKKNGDSVKQSIRLLLQTNFYNRLFHPEIGTHIPDLLYDNLTHFELSIIKDEIEKILTEYEPRIEINDIIVTNPENGYVLVKIIYNILNLGITDTYEYEITKITQLR